MSWVAVGVAVASAAVSQYNTAKTAKRQDRNAAAGIAEQSRLQREANARTDQQIDDLAQSGPEDEFRTRSGQIRDQQRRKQGMALAGITNTGGGDAVTQMAEAAGGQAVGYGDDINEWLSGMAAPGLQRQGEAFQRADVESSLNSLRRDSAQQDYLTKLKASGIRRNPWLDMLSTGLSAYSGAKGFGGGSTMAGAGGQANLGGMSPQQFYGATPQPGTMFGAGYTGPKSIYGIGPNLG